MKIEVNQPLKFYRIDKERIDSDPSKRTVENVFRVYSLQSNEFVREFRGVVPRIIGQTLPVEELSGIQSAVLSHDGTGVLVHKPNGERETHILPTPRSYSEDSRWLVETSEEENGVARFELFYKKNFSVIGAKSGEVVLKTYGIESRPPKSKSLMMVYGVRALHIPEHGQYLGITAWQAGTIWVELSALSS